MVYTLEPAPSHAVGIPYLAATAGALALSSHAAVRLLALIVLVGSASAYFAYWDAFLSVRCFFAAAASGVVLFHFEQSRRLRRAVAQHRGGNPLGD